MDERKFRILQAIIDDYILTAMPVPIAVWRFLEIDLIIIVVRHRGMVFFAPSQAHETAWVDN